MKDSLWENPTGCANKQQHHGIHAQGLADNVEEKMSESKQIPPLGPAAFRGTDGKAECYFRVFLFGARSYT